MHLHIHFLSAHNVLGHARDLNISKKHIFSSFLLVTRDETPTQTSLGQKMTQNQKVTEGNLTLARH